MKSALVHDYLAQSGGAERVAAAFHVMFPEAPLFTSVYDPKATLPVFQDVDIRTSYLQHWPISSRRFHKLALPYYPAAFEQFDFSGYDLVLSSSSSFAKGVITPPETCHVCYCHTPSRFIWRQHEYLRQRSSTRILSPLTSPLLRHLRAWDLESAQRVDYFIANSFNVARRVQKYYRRDVAAVVHPPVETNRFIPAPSDEVGHHFLVVSRLLSYKRIDLAVQACNRLGISLRVVGAGPELANLKRIAGPTVHFLGTRSDAEVAQELARCRALIFPGEEDFGITPLECMAAGRPVVAFGAGGALETIVEGQTGLFFSEQTVDSLAAALQLAMRLPFAPTLLRAHASSFDTSVFEAKMRSVIEASINNHCRRNSSHNIQDRSLVHDKNLKPPLMPPFRDRALAE